MAPECIAASEDGVEIELDRMEGAESDYMASVESKVDSAINRIKNLDEAVKELQATVGSMNVTLGEIKSTLKWHSGIGWTIASVYAMAFVGTLGWLLTSYIQGKINDRIPADFGERFGRMEANLENVQERLNNLTPGSLERLVPNPNSDLPAQKIADQMDSASNVVDFALQNEMPAAPDKLTPLMERVSEISLRFQKNPAVSTSANALSVRLLGYKQVNRYFLQSARKPPDLLNFNLTCSNPIGVAIAIPESVREPGTVFFGGTLKTCSQDLSGIIWINAKFQGSTLRYHGGPLYVSDVSFTNCSFDFGDDPSSQAVLAKIESRHGSPVTILIPPSRAG